MVDPNDVLAFIAPGCVIYSGFAYWRVMKVRTEVRELREVLSTAVQNEADNRKADSQRITQLHAEIEQVRQGFIQERTCPECDQVRPAKEFEQGDYICMSCRSEEFVDADGKSWPLHP